jgi:hypothetical protein
MKTSDRKYNSMKKWGNIEKASDRKYNSIVYLGI